jgi:4a-hydroxytetrahydrobiopterin dehydratase
MVEKLLLAEKAYVNPKKLSIQEIQSYAKFIPCWEIIGNNLSLKSTLSKKNYQEVIATVNKIAQLSEQLNHHPKISFGYQKITIEITTHSVGGLSINDFILAYQIDLCKKS